MWWKGIFICVIELGNSDESPLTPALRFLFTESSFQGRNNSLRSDWTESQSDLIVQKKKKNEAKWLTIVSKMQRHCIGTTLIKAWRKTTRKEIRTLYSCTIFSDRQRISLDFSFKRLLIAGLNSLLLFIIFYTLPTPTCTKTANPPSRGICTWPTEMRRQQCRADGRYCLVNSRYRLSRLRQRCWTQNLYSLQDDQLVSQSSGLNNYYFKTRLRSAKHE